MVTATAEGLPEAIIETEMSMNSRKYLVSPFPLAHFCQMNYHVAGPIIDGYARGVEDLEALIEFISISLLHYALVKPSRLSYR